jgi:hypothetical protein
MMVWLVRTGDRNILVDSGFYRDQFFKQWHVTDFVKPSEAIGRIGVKPEDITDVIITHMHWDHADGMDLFPNAKIWLQKEELEYYAGSAWQLRRTHGGIDPDDVLAAVRLNTQGRVGLVPGDAQEILPASPAIPAASIPTHRSSSPSIPPPAPSCWPATTCISTRIWKSTCPSPRRSTLPPTCARKIA